MSTQSDKLREMINNISLQSEALTESLEQIDEQITELNEQIDAIQNGVCGLAESQLVAYLDGTKIPELELIYFGEPYTIDYGQDFGTVDYTTGGITDFTIYDVTGFVVYQVNGVNWDNDPYILQLIDSYDFGNDYLTRPLTSGASYGLIPGRNNLLVAKGILEENKDKIDASETALEPFAT